MKKQECGFAPVLRYFLFICDVYHSTNRRAAAVCDIKMTATRKPVGKSIVYHAEDPPKISQICRKSIMLGYVCLTAAAAATICLLYTRGCSRVLLMRKIG